MANTLVNPNFEYSSSYFQDQDKSFSEGVGDFLTHGISAAALSAGLGIYNTGVALVNVLGGEAESADVGDTLRGMGATDTANYYKENQTGIDAVGFIAGSFIPGLGGIRALRAGQKAIAASTSTARLSTGFRRALVPDTRLTAVREEIATKGMDAYAAVQQNKLRTIAAGFHQQALEAAAFEGAVLLTMNQSSSLNGEDLDYFDAIQANLGLAATGLFFGTALGGIFEAVGNVGKLKGEFSNYAKSQGIGTIKVMQEGTNNKISAGHRATSVAQSYVQAKNIRTSPEFGALPKGEQADWNTKANNSELQLKLALKDVAGGDTRIADNLLKLIDEGKADPIELLSGVEQYKPMYLTDILFDVPTPQVEAMFDYEAAAWRMHLAESAGRPITQAAADAEVQTVYGAATSTRHFNMDEAGGVRAFARIRELLDANDPVAWNNMMTLRHEAGHLVLNHSAAQLSAKSPIMKKVLTSAQTLSRKSRPEDWARIDEYNKILESRGGLSKNQQRHWDYMNDPKELLADAYSQISNPNLFDAASASKEHPELFRFMVGNKALAGLFRKGKQAIDLQTGKLFPNGVTPTAADISPEIKLVKDNIHYGRGEVTKLGEKFDATKIDYLKASAKYAVAGLRKDIKADTVVDFYNLPDLTTAKALGLNVNVVRDGVQVRSQYQSLDDLIIHSKLEQAETLRRSSYAALEAKNKAAGITAKGKHVIDESTKGFSFVSIEESAGEVIEGARILTTGQIARILDVGEEFVLKSSAVKRLYDPKKGMSGLPAGALDDQKDLPFFSLQEGVDPRVPRHAIVRADRDAVVDGTRVWGIEATRQRINVMRESVNTAVAGYFKEDFETLPAEAFKSQVNAADNISPTDRTSGIVTSANQEVGTGGAFFQYIGNIVSKVMNRKAAEVSSAFDPLIIKLAADEGAVMEASVLDSVLRQAPSGMEYQFVPQTMKEWLDNIATYGDINEDVLEALEKSGVINSLFGPVDGSARIWRGEIRKSLDSMITDPAGDYETALDMARELAATLKDTVKTIKNPNLAKFWQDMVQYNGDEIVQHKNSLAARIGGNSTIDPKNMYPGPADTALYPHHALVVIKEQGLFGMQDTGMVVAKDAQDLQRKIADLRSQYTDKQLGIYTKKNIQKYKEAEGEYKGVKLFRDTNVNSLMVRKGIMWDVAPQPNPKLFNQYKESLVRQHRSLTRTMTEAKYGEEVAALDASSDWISTYNSAVGKDTKQRNVFSDMKAMMLNVHPDSTDNLWAQINTITDSAVSKALYTVLSAGRGAVKTGDWQKMNEVLDSYGMEKIYTQASQLLLTNVDAPKSVLGPLISKMNFVVGTSMLRMDSAHALVNLVSLPIMAQSEFAALQRFASKDRWQVLRDGTSVNIPGTKESIGSMLPMAHQAIKDFFTKPELVSLYRSKGLLTSTLEDMKAAEAQFSKLAAVSNTKTFTDQLNKVVDTISIPSDQSEQLAKFVSARIADLVTDTLRVPQATKWSTINAFVNRVNGNYIASQRPTLFQGWLGQAVGLFQTYQFNLLQSLFSNVAHGDKRAVATMLGLQAGIFGAQSVPGFQLMNQYIGERSLENNDFYKVSNSVLGDTAANWLMYGTASSAAVPVFGNGIDLYSRGDLTPRTPILLPTSPSEVPAIAVTGRFIGSVLTAVDRLSQGNATDPAMLKATMLDALAHSGFNRPLMGLAQLMQGERTTASGQTLAQLDSWDAWNVATRLMGSRPLDEAIAVNAFYRTNAYKVARQASLDSLGDAYRTQIRGGVDDPQSYLDTMSAYATRGGDIESFTRWAGNNYRNATQGQIDRLRNSNTSPQGRYLQEIMGAEVEEQLGDYSGIGF